MKKVLARLEAQCAKREYCSTDVLSKAVKALNGDTDRALEVLESLEGNGYVDDLRYASAFAREKSSLTGWGPVKIRYALIAKKIDAETVDSALRDTDEDKAESRLERLLQAKWKNLKGDPQAKLKLIKYALGRGYEYDDVRSAVEKTIDEDNEE